MPEYPVQIAAARIGEYLSLPCRVDRMQAGRFDVAHHFPGLAIYVDEPTGCFVDHVSGVRAEPQVSVGPGCNRKRFPQMRPLSEILAV